MSLNQVDDCWTVGRNQRVGLVTVQAFQITVAQQVNADSAFVEWARVHDNRYGTRRDRLEAMAGDLDTVRDLAIGPAGQPTSFTVTFVIQ